MKFAIITKPRVFMDWNNQSSLELGLLPVGEISIKAVTEFSCGVLSLGLEDVIRFADGCKSLAQKTTQSSVKISGDDGCFIQAQYTNDGDPFREGVRITMGVEEQWNDQITIDLDSYEALNLARAIVEQVSPLVAAPAMDDGEDKGLSVQDKAKCWDWFAGQDWNLQAVAAWGGLSEFDAFEYTEDLEAYILKQKQ